MRTERRKQAEYLKSKPFAIPPRYKAPKRHPAANEQTPTFKEQAQLQGADVPEWKLAELRLRSKRDEPLEKKRTDAGGGSQLSDEDEGGEDDEEREKPDPWAEASGAPRAGADDDGCDTSTLRRVCDGKGNIAFKGVDDIPANITDIKCSLVF